MNLAEETYETIVKTGWIKGDFERMPLDEEGFSIDDGAITGVCLLGGLGLACSNDTRLMDFPRYADVPKRYGEALHLAEILSKIVNDQYADRIPSRFGPEERQEPLISIPSFNDHEDTTLEDIELVCKKASMRLEEEI